MNAPSEESRFGHRPEEHVFGAHFRRPPTLRIRVAAIPGQTTLAFEPETEGQAARLAAALAAGPVIQSNLAFEPDEGEPLDRVAHAEAAAGLAHGPGDVAELVRLAGGGSPAAPAAAPARPVERARVDMAGDLEAELFGPRAGSPAAARSPSPRPRPPSTTPVTGAVAGAAAPAAPAGPNPQIDEPTTEFGASRGWISVFMSDRVAGAKRRRHSTIFSPRSAAATSAAGRVLSAAAGLVRRVLAGIDEFTSAYRLPLANLAWSAIICGLAVVLGAPPVLGGVFLGACVVLTLAGQSARNLLGYAGVILSSAALAEIVRQRERFFEILIALF